MIPFLFDCSGEIREIREIREVKEVKEVKEVREVKDFNRSYKIPYTP